MTGMDMALALCMLGVGVYMLVCGIRCKGFVYENEEFDYKSDYFQKYCRVVRIWCFAMFAILLITFVFSTLAYLKYYTITSQDYVQAYSTYERISIEKRYEVYTYIGYFTRITALCGIVLMVLTTTHMGSRAKAMREKQTSQSLVTEVERMNEPDNDGGGE